MPRLAPHILDVPASGIRRIYEIAATLDDVVQLAVGEPDWPVAPHIIEAARDAWARDDTRYTANGGIAPLRAAIAAKLARENGVEVDVEQVWVTAGGTQALNLAMHLTLAPGDEVLLPDPGYTTFTMNARMLGAEPVPYRLDPARGFMPDLDELESLVTPRTRLLIVNSPSNPLGVVFPRATLESLLDFARRHDLWILADEVYEHFAWGEPHTELASLSGAEGRVFSVHSFSKSYAMTGVRVGYLVTPPGFDATLRTMQEATISCVATPDQYAALAALEGPQDTVARARARYRAAFELAAAALDAKGVDYLVPGGAMYLWVDVAHVSAGDVAAWAARFVREQRVAVAPGSAFGASGEGWIRLCLAVDPDALAAGIERIPARLAIAAEDGDAGGAGAGER
ncbi:pyridoxal phosphate-dependent aminotransferase, partial [Agromyces seonyuensis]